MIRRLYLIRLCLRALVLAAICYLYLARRDLLLSVLNFRSFAAYAAWAVLMSGMIWHLLPNSRLSLAGRKQFAQNYWPREYKKEALAAFVKEANRRALAVMALWLAAHALIFWLYMKGVIAAAELLLLFTAYFVGDMFCVTLFCPFQHWGMRCRCCVDCRIFDWGHVMMYTPLAPLGGFFTRSLFIAAAALFLLWEIRFARHPERFWSGSNAALGCADCRDGLCRVKEPSGLKV